MRKWWIVLQADDNGPEIPVDQRALILDRFPRPTRTIRVRGLALPSPPRT
jgi:hypothetical protein